jgi:hypothetical protein
LYPKALVVSLAAQRMGAEALTSDDGDSADDVYERVDGQTQLISIGDLNGNATFLGISIDGHAVFSPSLNRCCSVTRTLRSTSTAHTNDKVSCND